MTVQNTDWPEESLIEAGHFGATADSLWSEHNFVDRQDLETVQRFLPTIDQWDNPRETEYDEDGVCIYDASYWWDRMCTGEMIREMSPKVHDIITKYINKIGDILEAKFDLTLYRRSPVLVRWLPGFSQPPHADKQLDDGKPNAFLNYDLNSLIYWNDDFEGGQFYYPDYGIEYEIEAGMAAAHPGDVNYMHGVKEIRSGIRWTTPSFYTIKAL